MRKPGEIGAEFVSHTRSIMGKNTLCHIEFVVSDVQKAKAFYASLFDWEFRDYEGGMVVFGHGSEHIGGISQGSQPAVRGNSPSVWFEVDSVDATLEKVIGAGGTLRREKQLFGPVGFTATFADLDGNEFGVVEFKK